MNGGGRGYGGLSWGCSVGVRMKRWGRGKKFEWIWEERTVVEWVGFARDDGDSGER